MHDDSFTENEYTDGAEEPAEVGRHRLPSRFAGRKRYLAAGAAVLVGLGVAGVSLITVGHNESPTPAAVSLDSQARAEAAERADRSTRESSGPVTPSATDTTPPTASASPSPSASPSASRPAPKPSPTKAKPKPAWVNPLPGAETTSCFGQRWGTLHAGIDLAQPEGTPIHAAAAGTVVNAGWAFSGYGISVVIDHGNGYLTHYAHQSRTIVQVGDKVTAGQIIGYEGATGDATGPHLHFEVHQGELWNQIDPAPFMRKRGIDLGC